MTGTEHLAELFIEHNFFKFVEPGVDVFVAGDFLEDGIHIAGDDFAAVVHHISVFVGKEDKAITDIVTIREINAPLHAVRVILQGFGTGIAPADEYLTVDIAVLNQLPRITTKLW